MFLQQHIDQIIYSHKPLYSKFIELKIFFEKENIHFFADFDDTISDNHCLFYTKIKFLLKYKTQDEKKAFDYVINQFSLNKRFVALLHKKNIHQVVILSRNNHHFLNYFTKWFNTHYPSSNFSFIGSIWSTKDFVLNTHDKMTIIPSDTLLISDMFEYKQLKDLPNFLSIDRYTPLLYYCTFAQKLVRFLFFVLSVLWKKF